MNRLLVLFFLANFIWVAQAQAELKTWETTRKLGSEKEIIADCYSFYTAYGEYMRKFEPNLAAQYVNKVLAGGGSMALNEMKLYRENNPDFSGSLEELKNFSGQAYKDRTNAWIKKIDTMNAEQISEQKDICMLMQPKMDALKQEFEKSKLKKAGNK